MLLPPRRSWPSSACLQAQIALSPGSPLFMPKRIAMHSSRRLAESRLASKGETNNHNSSHLNASLPPSCPSPSCLTSHERLQRVVPQAFGVDDSVEGEAHNQQSGRGRGSGVGRGGGRTGRGGRGHREQKSQRPGSGKGGRGGGRASRGRAGFANNSKSPEQRVPSLEMCIQNAADTAHVRPDSMAYCMYSLAKRVGMDTQKGIRHSSSERADVVDAARKLMRQLLGSSSSSKAPASSPQPPVQQLDSKLLSLLAWSLSVMVHFDASLSAGARQLCYALAVRAAQPGIIRANVHEACRCWASLLYGLANVGLKCSDDARVKQVFHFCMEQELPDLLCEGQVCQPQSVSNVAMACEEAGYEGSMEPFISALARRLSGGLMANAAPQAWSNLLYACAKLEQRGVQAGGGLGGGMSIIAEVRAAAMAGALKKPVKYQPNFQDLAHTLWGLSYVKWYDANILRVLAQAVVERMESSTPQGISNVLLALAKFKWYDEGVVSELAAGMVAHIEGSTTQGISNTFWALATFGWFDEGVVSKLAAGMVERIDNSTHQGISYTLWALAKLKWYDEGVVCKLAAGMVERIESSTPQSISNTLWALAKLKWYDEGVVSMLAAGMVECIDSSTPQGISKTLWALSTLGWYDSSVHDALLVALLDKHKQLAPRDCSTALYSCAVASHGSRAMVGLAEVISTQDVSKQGGWDVQSLANSLYAWAVLSSVGIASGSLNTMAQHLMREVNDRGSAAFQTLHMTQLYMAHLEAERVWLQGGGLSAGMLQAAADQHEQGRAELQKKTKQAGGGGFLGVRQAAAALWEAGFEVELEGIVGQGEFFAELLVRHEIAPSGIAVDVLSDVDVFRHPLGQISGISRQKHVQLRQRCDGLVVLSEAATKQPGLVVQQLEQELMRVAARWTW